ncbi:MAG: phage tail sheath family protein [Anaerovoracaceae bacterium]
MALGGGKFTSQNKVLPGAYINVISAKMAQSALSNRGVVAIPLEFDWCVDNEIFTFNSEDFDRKALRTFGRNVNDEKLKPIRELIKGATVLHLFKINSGGVKASNDIAEAKYTGARGNDLAVSIIANPASESGNEIYDVITYLDGINVDSQTVKNVSGLVANDFVTFKSNALALTAKTSLTGGTNGTVSNENHKKFLDKAESYGFNILATTSTDETIKALFFAYTKRMRDEIGKTFQCVLHKSPSDYIGIISVENNLTGELVPWVAGKQAGCRLSTSLTNAIYDGEYEVKVDYTQTQLETALGDGKFIFHKEGDSVRVLEDINSYVTFTEEQNEDFRENQAVRVLDQIGNDIAVIFNTRYLGKIANDKSGRDSFWSDIVKHHQALQTDGAIENFKPEDIVVIEGENKKSIVVSDRVTPTSVMNQLYMTVIAQ